MQPRPSRIEYAAALLVGVIVGLCPGPHRAAAQSCDLSQELEVTPANAATRVALDAHVMVRYPDEDITAVRAAFDDGESLIELLDLGPLDREDDAPARIVGGGLSLSAERIVYFEPLRLLAPSHEYQLTVFVPGLSVGGMQTVFETGPRRDSGPPTFTLDEGEVELVSRPAPESCGLPDGALAVGLSFPPGDDDSDLSAVEHFGFLTRAAGLEAPRLLARWRHGGSRALLNFYLLEEETAEPVCVMIRVVDGVGRVAEDPPEICFDPIQGSFFRPLCSVATVGSRGREGGPPRLPVGFLISWALVALAGRRRTRARMKPPTTRSEDPA